jgi:hypothetical protein
VLTDADATHAFIGSPIGMLLLFGYAGNAVEQIAARHTGQGTSRCLIAT